MVMVAGLRGVTILITKTPSTDTKSTNKLAFAANAPCWYFRAGIKGEDKRKETRAHWWAGKCLACPSLRGIPIILNNVGGGQPDIHNAYANNEFLDTRGLPSPVAGARAGYILQRLADASKPFWHDR